MSFTFRHIHPGIVELKSPQVNVSRSVAMDQGISRRSIVRGFLGQTERKAHIPPEAAFDWSCNAGEKEMNKMKATCAMQTPM